MDQQTIFDRLVEVDDPTRRTALLDELCRGDPALKEQVVDALRKHDLSIARTEFPSRPDDTKSYFVGKSSELIGTWLGSYHVLERLGEGGMGLVFLAQQNDPVQRRVAIKITKSGVDDQERMTRFHAERQALALMDHENIAKVFDAGTTEDGRLYLVMELVKGDPITTYSDTRRLTTDQRLELFIPVCRAIQHAHQRGVLHRDVKPSNVLVAESDHEPYPKVIDFGLAKSLQQQLTAVTLHTQQGQVLGTLEYMSPEQANYSSQDVDTRTDVYSLGVLLYELLTGTTPIGRQRLKDGSLEEVLKAIREEEPSRPSYRLSEVGKTTSDVFTRRSSDSNRLRKTFRGDLDSIVLKALAKDRNRRYDSAAALADDIQRYLDDEPIEARPPSAMYLISKFARRHRAVVAGCAAVFGALTLGIAFSTYFAFHAAGQRKLAEENLQRARAAESKATEEAQHAEAQAALAKKQSDLAFDTLADVVFQIQSPLAEIPTARAVRQDMLEQAIGGLKEVAENLNQRTDTDQTLMTAFLDLGDIFHNLGASNDDPDVDHRVVAEQQYRKAMHIADLRLREDPNNIQRRYDLYVATNRMGNVHATQGRNQEALESKREAAEIMASLAEMDAEEYLGGYWNACFALSGQYFVNGDVELANEWTQKGIRVADEVRARQLELVDPISEEAEQEMRLRGDVFPLLPPVYEDIELAFGHRPEVTHRLLLDRAKLYLAKQDHDEVALTMERLIGLSDLSHFTYYSGACRYVGCAELIRGDRPLENLSHEQRDKYDEYCSTAIDLLHKSIDGGAVGPGWLPLFSSDPDLDPLRKRDDFEQVMTAVKEKS